MSGRPIRLARRTIYKNPWVSLYVDRVRFPGGRIVPEHHVIESSKTAVGVVVQDRRSQILLARTYRYTTGEIQWEIPAGTMEPRESWQQAARREVLEETGYTFENLRPL